MQDTGTWVGAWVGAWVHGRVGGRKGAWAHGWAQGWAIHARHRHMGGSRQDPIDWRPGI